MSRYFAQVAKQDREAEMARLNPPPAFEQTALLHDENAGEFEALRNSLLAEHQPQTPTEHYFVNEMANAQWRLRRIRLIESDLIRLRRSADTAGAGDAQPEALPITAESTRALHFVLKHEAALRRQFERALKMFWECSHLRRQRTQPQEEAEKQKLQKRSQSISALAEFERRLNEFCSAPPPLPPPQPDFTARL